MTFFAYSLVLFCASNAREIHFELIEIWRKAGRVLNFDKFRWKRHIQQSLIRHGRKWVFLCVFFPPCFFCSIVFHNSKRKKSAEKAWASVFCFHNLFWVQKKKSIWIVAYCVGWRKKVFLFRRTVKIKSNSMATCLSVALNETALRKTVNSISKKKIHISLCHKAKRTPQMQFLLCNLFTTIRNKWKKNEKEYHPNMKQ